MRLLSSSNGGGATEESESEGEDDEEINPLLLDPTEWKVLATCTCMYM